jgi:hypothetical protein
MSHTTRTHPTTRALEASAWALVLFQVVHGFTPADTDSEGYVGLVGGLLLLVAALTAVYGIRTGRRWARALTGWAGLTVAVGFVLYHALPFKSPVTNPYLGEPVGAPARISVALAVAAGAWAAYEAFAREPGGAL